MRRHIFLIMFFLAVKGWGQPIELPANPAPDDRFKTDLLLIVAHPDDETAIGSYLAKAKYDDGKRIACIYLNRGNGGGNSIGNEQSMAMANIREIEVHRALAKFDIFNVWILDGKDTPGQDLFHSLLNAGHGAALEKIVRLIRLTRPEVILTWMPIFVAGENHGDHQAAGVLATEAFDLAGDPNVFPTQVTVPRDRIDINNFQEGLLPWQPKKIYYYSDRDEPIGGAGPQFDITTISKTQKKPYYEIAAPLLTPHLVQGDVARSGIDALQSGDFTALKNWLKKFRLVLGKSLVPCKPEGDVFEGITDEIQPYTRNRGYQPGMHSGITVAPGGIFEFYRTFWAAHNIEHLANLLTPEITIAGGSYLQFPLLLRNRTDQPVELVLKGQFPDGWEPYSGDGLYRLQPGAVYPAQTMSQAPWRETGPTEKITWTVQQNGKQIGSVTLDVNLREWTLPQ